MGNYHCKYCFVLQKNWFGRYVRHIFLISSVLKFSSVRNSVEGATGVFKGLFFR